MELYMYVMLHWMKYIYAPLLNVLDGEYARSIYVYAKALYSAAWNHI